MRTDKTSGVIPHTRTTLEMLELLSKEAPDIVDRAGAIAKRFMSKQPAYAQEMLRINVMTELLIERRRCAAIAEEQVYNTNVILTNPQKSSAAVSIANSIIFTAPATAGAASTQESK